MPKTKKAITPEKISPVINEKFLPVSLIRFPIASLCSGVISFPLKNPSMFKSNLFEFH